MPFLRTSKGTKLNFSQARLSSLLSLVYLEAMGNQTPKYRFHIQKHCQKIWKSLEDMFGKKETDEWPAMAIQKEIDRELSEHASMEVHEAFLTLKIHEFQEQKKSNPTKLTQWNQFEAKPVSPVLQNDIDPLWAIIKLPISTLNSNTIHQSLQNITTKNSVETLSIRRSEWIQFFKNICQEYTFFSGKTINFSIWEKHLQATSLDQKNKTANDWWLWFQNEIDQVLTIDPQLYILRQILYHRKKRGYLLGEEWFDGSSFTTRSFTFDYQNQSGLQQYKQFAVEHLKSIFRESFPHIEWNWEKLKTALDPIQDYFIDWKGWNHMEDSGALRTIQHTWTNGITPHSCSTELPQWAFLRGAMAMAVYSSHPDKRTEQAIALYQQISRLNLIPSVVLLREAGKKSPQFFEDSAWDVADHYSSIQKVIYNSAIDTTWTGTSASNWSKVRSKNVPVRSGQRKSTGVNDFLRILDSQLKAQGRLGEDRPVTVILPIWHLDIEEFIQLQHENGQRLQPVILISDLFMKKVAEMDTWCLYDPHVYPEILEKDGYLLAEKKRIERQKEYPYGHKMISAEKLWKKILTQARLGSPYLTFVDSNSAFSISENGDEIQGLDGVGSFPLSHQQDTFDSRKISWPTLTINVNNMISEQGEPYLEKWKDTMTWAFWTAECMYEASQHVLTQETLDVRPLCLGAVGFYEAIQKATMGNSQDEEALSAWVYRISETWTTLVTVVDQFFAQKNGPAPLFLDSSWETHTFHPLHSYEKLKQQRNGSSGIYLDPYMDHISDIFDKIQEHRFGVRSVWAPFKHASLWSGVSPGGFGTLFPTEWIMDQDKIWRLSPTNYLLYEMEHIHHKNYGDIFSYPNHPSKWPEHIRKLSTPDMAEWKIRLKHASLVRIWIEQGVSLTLPSGIPMNQLSILLQQAWWLGISNIRFEDLFKKPDILSSNISIN